MMSRSSAPISRPGPVRRLTFSYDGDQVRLVGEQIVTMLIPPSHPLERLGKDTGFTVILRDERGEPVYGRVIQSPFRFDEEVFDPDPVRSVRREANPRPQGTFVILVPAFENARRLEFFGQPLRPKAHADSPRLLASFALGALPNP